MGCTVEQTGEYLQNAMADIRQELLAGHATGPAGATREHSRSRGRERELGIPTVMDRLIQQALLQVLQPIIDPTLQRAQLRLPAGAKRARRGAGRRSSYVQAGLRVVVDVDLEKFFDRVNHDILMDRLAKRIADKRVLRLIRAT